MMVPIALVLIVLSLVSQWVRAAEVKVIGNDTRLVFSGTWEFIAGRCDGDGYVQALNRTYSVSLIFKGTAVSISLLKVFDGCLAAIYLDGTQLGSNIDLIDPAVRYYQCLRSVTNSTTLSNVNHNLTIQHAGTSPNAVEGNLNWLALIDIVYTTPDDVISTTSSSSTLSSSSTASTSSAQPSSSPPSGAKQPTIIGGIVGGIVGGLLLGALFSWFFFHHRRKNSREEEPLPATGFPHDPNTPLSPTPFYAPLPVTYPYAAGGAQWNPYNAQDNRLSDVPSSGDRPTSMVSASNVHRDLPPRPELDPSGSAPPPPPPKPGYPGWNPSSSGYLDSTATDRNNSPPPPMYHAQ